jgi:hypothetical protein
MTIEIRKDWSLSVLPLPKEIISVKAQAKNLPSSEPREPIVQLKRVGSESDPYAEPGSVIDIYV